MASVATKVTALFRKKGAIMLVISVVGALLAAKGGPPIDQHLGFWDGPS